MIGRRPGCPGYDGSFLERPILCAVPKCEAPAERDHVLADGIHPHTLRLCRYCDAELARIGLFDQLFGATVEARHWLDDEGPDVVRFPPPWRVVEWGLAGKERPTLARIVAREALEAAHAAPNDVDDPETGPPSWAPWSPQEPLGAPPGSGDGTPAESPPDVLALF